MSGVDEGRGLREDEAGRGGRATRLEGPPAEQGGGQPAHAPRPGQPAPLALNAPLAALAGQFGQDEGSAGRSPGRCGLGQEGW
jgi:hypothetical protein